MYVSHGLSNIIAYDSAGVAHQVIACRRLVSFFFQARPMANPQVSAAAFGKPSRSSDAATVREANHFSHHFPHDVLRKLLLRDDSTSLLPPPPSSAPMTTRGSQSAISSSSSGVATALNANHSHRGDRRDLDCRPMQGFTQSTTIQTFDSDCYRDPFHKTRGAWKGDGTCEPPPPWNSSHCAEQKSKITARPKVQHSYSPHIITDRQLLFVAFLLLAVSRSLPLLLSLRGRRHCLL